VIVTNPHPAVAEHLRSADLQHTVHHHSSFDRAISSPHDFADALKIEVECICKTLLMHTGRGTFIAAIASAPARLDLRAVAEAVDVPGRLELASRADLGTRTGYPPNGVSPLGLSDIAIVIDSDVLGFPRVLIGAGVAGIEIELSPLDLVSATGARVAPITAR
jgi:Cys-tRNA(Pro)/Cys-tRNA(Cys) deacylase